MIFLCSSQKSASTEEREYEAAAVCWALRKIGESSNSAYLTGSLMLAARFREG